MQMTSQIAASVNLTPSQLLVYNKLRRGEQPSKEETPEVCALIGKKLVRSIPGRKRSEGKLYEVIKKAQEAPGVQPEDDDTAEEIRAFYRQKWDREHATKDITFLVRFLRALAVSDLSTETRWTAAVMAIFGDWVTGKNSYPSQQVLAALTGKSQRAVRRHTRELDEAGFTDTETGKGRLSSRYNLAIPKRTVTELAELMGVADEGGVAMGVGGTPAHGGGSNRTYAEGLPGHECPPIILQDQMMGSDDETEKGEVSSLAIPLKYTDATRPDFQEVATGSEIEDFQEMALALKDIDDNRILAPVLFREEAYAELAALAKKCHVKFIEEAARDILYSSRIDGKMRAGGIRSWNYFAGKALDYQREDALYRAGVAPGDRTFLQKGLMSYE